MPDPWDTHPSCVPIAAHTANTETDVRITPFRTGSPHQRPITGGLLHQSHRGSQYAALTYQPQLTIHIIQCSVSRPGNYWDDAVVESFFASLKTEVIYRRRVQARQEDQNAVFSYMGGFYTRPRRHTATESFSRL